MIKTDFKVEVANFVTDCKNKDFRPWPKSNSQSVAGAHRLLEMFYTQYARDNCYMSPSGTTMGFVIQWLVYLSDRYNVTLNLDLQLKRGEFRCWTLTYSFEREDDRVIDLEMAMGRTHK